MRNEYKNKVDRLQMSLFSILYSKAKGYLMIPNFVFNDLDKTEWGKLNNFIEAKKIIEEEYFIEVNNTIPININVYNSDSFPADERFSTEEAKVNKAMIESYKNFVLRVGNRLNLKFKNNFSYFQK